MTRKPLVLATAALLAAAVGATTWYAGGFQSSGADEGDASDANSSDAAGYAITKPYIIVFGDSEALATYRGGVRGLVAPARVDAAGSVQLDVDGVAATRYVQFLEGEQRAHESQIATLLGRSPTVLNRMQHALNAIVVRLSEAEAERVAKMVDVALVEAYREVPLQTDVGPALIGAEPVWQGTVAGVPRRIQGEGVVVGIIDTGINHDSPSFSAVDPIDGYRHVNPLGSGNYLGTCAPGQVDEGKCNDKLIGGYDFVCGPPGNACANPGFREEPGFVDTNTHGSHVAGTAAGNRRDAIFRGRTVRISGVAPRANLVAFDVCYTNIATGQGSCPNTSSVAAVNQAVADGVVDVLNFSIGGGANPWTDAVSMAFLNAADAGIYIAASAGNSGPGPNTMSHNEPWVGTTAAANSGRQDFALLMQVTSPSPVPAVLNSIILAEGSGGVALSAAVPDSSPLRISPTYDGGVDGCAAFPAGTFTGSIAVLQRGGCAFADKANSAAAAGAVAIVIGNNAAGAISPSVPGATIPAFGVTQAVGIALRDFGRANASATAGIRFPATPIPNTPDALAGFSSRGPAGNFPFIKPDITAPGVNILATIAGIDPNADDSQAVGLLSGTSMASPHHAGAAALLRSARPNLTVSEMKSAFMTTAVQTVLLPDEVTPANAFAGGAGRIQVDHALRAPLVFNETKANFIAANPAVAGGDPVTLNLASVGQGSCVGTCTFKRTVRNAWSTNAAYQVKLTGLPGSVSPSMLFLSPNQSKVVTITINGSSLPANGQFNFGTVTFTGSNNTPVQRLPLAIAVQPPAISLPASLSAALATNSTAQVPFTIGNTGGAPLQFNYLQGGSAPFKLENPFEFAFGYVSTRYSDPLVAGVNARFAADDFVLGNAMQVTQLTSDGFTGGGTPVTPTTAQAMRWSIYPDAGGVPAGNPASAAGAAVWSYSSTLTAPGISLSGNRVSLNMAAAGQSLALPAGRYWLVVNSVGTNANRWLRLRSTGSSAGMPGIALITVASDGSGAWAADPAVGLTMSVTGTVACGAPWITGMTPASGSILPGQSRATQATLQSNGLGAGNYKGFLCVSSNDPARPVVATPVNMAVGGGA